MTVFYLVAALALMLLMAIGLQRVMAGPTAADRLLAVQLFGTMGVAIVLLLGRAQGDAAFMDLALTFALLAIVFSVTFARFANEFLPSGDDDQAEADR